MAFGAAARRCVPRRIRSVKILAAGGTFAGTTIVGLLLGIFISGRTGQQLWVLGGVFLGLGVGGYSAVRMLMAEIR